MKSQVNQGWWRWRFTPLKGILLALFFASVVVALVRLFTGLGAVTNLSDTAPWGIWKAVDVIVVVPLGAAGFTMAFVRYVLKADRYEHISRRAVIWAAICYLSAGARLGFDIGLPWRLPNPLLFGGNIHSPLFEVAWCMALYLIVLFLENIPRVMERFQIQWVIRLEHFIHKILPAFVLFGVLLSTMHQSTLGTLFMVMGKRLDPLWYHPWLNYVFLLTAIAAGLGVTILIEGWSNYYYKTRFETNLLSKLALGIAVSLSLAFAWRIGHLAAAGTLSQVFTLSGRTLLWWTEMLVGYAVPLAMLWNPKQRNNQSSLILAAGAVVGGMILFRLNTALVATAAALGSNYFPSVAELLFTVGATAGTMVIYTWFVETLPSYLGQDADHGHESAAD